MIQQIFNWRILLALIAIGIVTSTIFYSRYLANKIANEEKQKVEEWVEAGKFLINPATEDTRLPLKIIQNNENDVPIIETNESDSIMQYINLDSTKIAGNNSFLEKKLRDFKAQNQPIVWVDPQDSNRRNLYYYGESRLLTEVRYYPIVQLIIVGFFILITILALRSSYRSVQNQVWAGMAKETAHQLGTPVSSLRGWVEMLKQDSNSNDKLISELEKDVGRLELVSDRFGKIGSKPQLETREIIGQVTTMVDYMKKRAPGKVNFVVTHGSEKEIYASISPPLFDWVIENLLKNSLDAMEGTGTIKVNIENLDNKVHVDLADTGKGIPLTMQRKVFKPGYTTKKRGWGLGLSLSKRIIEQFHKGQIFVKSSEPGKGTTFRIVLKK